MHSEIKLGSIFKCEDQRLPQAHHDLATMTTTLYFYKEAEALRAAAAVEAAKVSIRAT